MTKVPDSSLMKIKVKAGKEYEVDLNEMLALNENSLVSAYEDQASLYAWWKAARAIAKKYKAQLSKKLSLRRSLLAKDLKAQSDKGLLAWKSWDIEARILSDKEYDLLADKIIWADYHVDLLEAVIGALDHRKEMIIGLGASVRREKNQY